MTFRPLLAVAVASLVSLGGLAEAQYRWVDAEGRVHYSNLPPVTPTPRETPEPARAPAAEPKTPAPAPAKATAPEPAKRPTDPKALIEEVLELSGTKKQIAQIPAAVQAQLAQRHQGQPQLKPADYARLSQIIADAYRADALYRTVAETFKRRYEEQRLVAAWESLRTPLLRRITQLEVDAAGPERMERVQQFAALLQKQPPPAERVALLRRLDEAGGATQASLDIMVATARGLMLAVDPLLPASKRLKPGQLEQMLDEMRAQVQAPLREQSLVSLLYTYRSLSDNELRQYLAFLESEAGRWFYRVAREGILTAMTAAAEQAGRRMGGSLAAAPAQSPAVGVPAATPSAPTQKQWALAASAILAERNGQRHDLLGGDVRTEASVRHWKQIMRDWWGVQSRADLFMILKYLDESGHRESFDQLGAFVESLSPEQYGGLKAKTRLNPEAAHQLAMVEKYYKKLGKKSLLGWDYARYIALCRWGYLVGHLSEEEAWERIMQAARTLQSTFDSWQDLGENYLVGREFWGGSGREDSQLYRAAYLKLLDDPGSPWKRYAWKMSLEPPAATAPPHSARAAAGVRTR